MINTTTAEASKQASKRLSDYMTPRCMIKTGNVSWITWAEWNSPYVCWFHLFLPFAAYNCWFNLRADDVTSEARFSTHNDNREEVIFNLNIYSTWHVEWFWASNTIRLIIWCLRFSDKKRFRRRSSVGRILGFSLLSLPVEKQTRDLADYINRFKLTASTSHVCLMTLISTDVSIVSRAVYRKTKSGKLN